MLKISLLIVLAIAFILELWMTGKAFVSPSWLLESFAVPSSPGALVLSQIIAWFLGLATALIALALFWIQKEHSAGDVLALNLALFWIGIGVGIYSVSGITTNLIVDSLKGLMICGLIALRYRSKRLKSFSR